MENEVREFLEDILNEVRDINDSFIFKMYILIVRLNISEWNCKHLLESETNLLKFAYS